MPKHTINYGPAILRDIHSHSLKGKLKAVGEKWWRRSVLTVVGSFLVFAFLCGCDVINQVYHII